MLSVAESPGAAAEEDAEAMLSALGVSLEDVLHELDYRRRRRYERALATQRAAARLQGERKPIRGGDVGGEVDFQLHPVFYHYWGQRLGYECFDDPQFVRELKRDNPEVRVVTRNDRIVSGYGSKANSAPNAPRRAVRGRRGRWAL